MALWCRDIPTARIARAAAPKHVTLVLPYYDNQNFLQTQLDVWRRYPAALSAWLSIILVDDGSPTPCVKPADLPRLRLFRIEVDVRWNWLAARNIGAHHAADGWLVMTDMDHVLPVDTLDALIHGAHQPKTVYAFSRREHIGDVINPHSASFFMTRERFWDIGGYDEALSGHYGTDGDYRRRLARVASIAILPEQLERHEYVGDSSTTRYLRKQPQDAAVKQLIAKRRLGWRPRVLSFPYHEVTA